MKHSSLSAALVVAILCIISGCDSDESGTDDLGRLADALGCDIEEIAVNTDVAGTLAAGDCRRPDGSFIDYYAFRLDADADVTIDHTSTEVDPFLILYSGTGSVLATHDDIIDSVNQDSRIERALEAGLYAVGANSYDTGETGTYTIRVTVP